MKTLKQIANNQVVVCEGNYGAYKYEFYSYGTLIGTYEEETRSLTLTEYYDYSRTTSKYLKIFLNDYCDIYYSTTNELRKYIKEGKYKDVNIKAD